MSPQAARVLLESVALLDEIAGAKARPFLNALRHD
jgi:hypothetical protein